MKYLKNKTKYVVVAMIPTNIMNYFKPEYYIEQYWRYNDNRINRKGYIAFSSKEILNETCFFYFLSRSSDSMNSFNRFLLQKEICSYELILQKGDEHGEKLVEKCLIYHENSKSPHRRL